MKKIHILSPYEKMGIFSPCYTKFEKGGISVVKVKNNVRALRKTCLRLNDGARVIGFGLENEKLFSERKVVYNDYSCEHIMPIAEKLCRIVAERYGIQVPFGEVYIVASPLVACSLISALYRLSRIFTIVSEEETIIKKYDELYFKHGTLIRHLPQFASSLSADAIVINCEGNEVPSFVELPVINMSKAFLKGDRVLSVSEILLSDEAIMPFAQVWGGKCGVCAYSLLGVFPSDDTIININEKADSIFLLDTEHF